MKRDEGVQLAGSSFGCKIPTQRSALSLSFLSSFKSPSRQWKEEKRLTSETLVDDKLSSVEFAYGDTLEGTSCPELDLDVSRLEDLDDHFHGIVFGSEGVEIKLDNLSSLKIEASSGSAGGREDGRAEKEGGREGRREGMSFRSWTHPPMLTSIVRAVTSSISEADILPANQARVGRE